ncbi:MAG: preprotein translocase subunit SecG [Cyclobacteriaceae bacterium]
MIAIISLIILVAVVLVLVVLAQNSKGGGLSSQFGGSGTSQLMGVKKTGDILEKMTWGLAIALMVLTLSTKFVIKTPTTDEFTSPNIESAQDKNVMPAIDIPAEQPAESSDSIN